MLLENRTHARRNPQLVECAQRAAAARSDGAIDVQRTTSKCPIIPAS